MHRSYDPGLVHRLQLQLVAVDPPPDVSRCWRLFSFNEKTGVIGRVSQGSNIIPYQEADILAKLIAGNSEYVPGALFFEYENTAGNPTVPSPVRGEGIDYYLNDLKLAPKKDYLRVPLVVPAAITSTGSDYAGNRVTFFAISTGVLGVHGLTFDDTVNSKVYGLALAATPVPAQYTQDLLFSRTYEFTARAKMAGQQIGAQCIIRFR